MKTILAVLLFAGIAQANTLTWQDNSTSEDGFAIEMLAKGVWSEVARVGTDVVTYTDKFTEGVYRVRAFVNVTNPDGTPGTVFSAYSNTAAKLNSPVIQNIK